MKVTCGNGGGECEHDGEGDLWKLTAVNVSTRTKKATTANASTRQPTVKAANGQLIKPIE